MKKVIANLTFLNQKEKIALDLLTRRMKANLKDNLVKIQLFGSKVRGDFDKDSDIDVLLIVKDKNKTLIDDIYRIDQDIDLEYDIKTSFKIYSLDEFKKIKNYRTFFYLNIEKEAVTI